ncbi:expressed unknown protein [Seminavis robusta]|uniref:DUF6824 domain-containing protein n=1 Tax=Seminavis robusta TaxID=568900 RepID=A0A9N8HAA1_9STRA|nr:expressed unknown protein [Seminavis robusta]|eukprot:Sro311_g114340.1 n/a (586) ;mRNA; r:52032-53789
MVEEGPRKMAENRNRKQYSHQRPYHRPLQNYAPVTPRQVPPPPPPPMRDNRTRGGSFGMMNFVESFMSPFTQCWQPPIDACGTGDYADYPGCGPTPPPPVATRGPPPPPPPRPPAALVTPMPAPAGAYPYPTGPPPPPQVHYGGQSPHAPREMMFVERPTDKDVLCGRGGSSNKHNLHFRELIAANKATYVTLTKKQKMLVSRQVVETIHRAGGRFLAKDNATGMWKDIGMSRSLEKASQALREKTTNMTASDAVVVTEDCGGIETMSTHSSSTVTSNNTPKPSSKTIEAPPLIIPPILQDVYKPKMAPPPGLDTPVSHPAATTTRYPYHPSDRVQSMPAPHMGAYPFHNRQMSRLNQHSRSFPHPSEARGHAAPMVSPVSHGMSWQPQHPGAYHRHHPSPTIHNRKSWDYHQSDVGSYTSDSTATHSTAEFRQYSHHPPIALQHSHSPPHQETGQHIKRQRTNEEERELEEDEEDVILFEDSNNTISLKDTSLEEGSLHLPAQVKSKLSLKDRVISPAGMVSPSGMMQGRTRRHHPQEAPDSPTIPTGTATATESKLNTSAEAEGLAGLAALSTAAFLRMDEGE